MMKKCAKRICFALAVCILSTFIMSSCAEKVSLKDRGMKAIAIVHDMAGHDIGYPNVFSDELEKIKASDYTYPQAVYKLTLRDQSHIVPNDVDGITKDYLSSRATSLALQKLMDKLGTLYSLLSSELRAEYTFVDRALAENVTYLYIFKDGYPMSVSFIKGDDGAVLAVGNVIPEEELKGASPTIVKRYFNEYKFDADSI